MPLEQYRAKRDFTQTREPKGRTASGHKRPIFVIQEHHASHLHYDFRLEADGVLKSWAVPRQPSMDPSQKRLAVQVEDHPLAYATFEGTIPEGQYGAGRVAIWDEGTYDNLLNEKSPPRTMTEALAAGRLEFALHGKVLQGKFALVRMKGRGRAKPEWLLIKMKDEFARAGDPAPSTRERSRASTRAKRIEPPPSPARKPRPPRGGVAVTHPDRLMFPEANLTKGDIFAYYGRIADRLLPFLKDRPVTLERLPEGLSGTDAPHFWQKDIPRSFPDWIARASLRTERGETVHYALVNDRDTLLYLVNQGTVTFHIWASRIQDLDRPDFVLFDLDRSQALFADVVAVARALRRRLKAEGVEPFVKTSGKTGLHILVPWTAPGGYDAARAWAGAVAGDVADSMPDAATMEIRKAKRGTRVYIDVLQNARGHHAVPPYVIRAIPAATISTPLGWRELRADLDPARFTARSIPRRLARHKSDPFAPLLRSFTGPGRRAERSRA